MPTIKRKTALKTANPCRLAISRCIEAHRSCARGVLFYTVAMAFIALILSFNFGREQPVYMVGQVAEQDVVADRYALAEDVTATEERRRQIAASVPQVYDYSMENYVHFEQRLVSLMQELTGTPPKEGPPSAVEYFTAALGEETARDILPEFKLTSTQSFILRHLLYSLRERMLHGVVGSARAARMGRGKALIRNLDTGGETVRGEDTDLPSMDNLLEDVSYLAQEDKSLSHNSRRAIGILLTTCLPPTLTLNQEATQQKGREEASRVAAITYQIQKGDVVARRGDRITSDQQAKMQALHRGALPLISLPKAAGLFLLSLFISLGLFISPSGRQGTVIHTKDLMLMAIVAIFTALSARGVHLLGSFSASQSMIHACCTAFPVAGAVGFAATVFSARRYVALGLLLTLCTSVALELGLYFALFHFLSAMLSTWLVSNALSRQDAVWNLFPIILGEILLIFAVAMLENLPLQELPMLFIAVCINAVLMLILFFSFSPVLETLLGYSTRFKLMEYTNLEQPLMQEIMVTIPGTYHHSLVVSNMAEAGAKAIGANSLLTKVAALYHDCGKLMYPQYFVENQFSAPNRHDKLLPSMSALIITSHVKKGLEICRQYGLGDEITDIISQHHGNRVLKFFYDKALKMGENPRKEDYSYAGPAPQSREAAILMLADSVEASSRTLKDPTPKMLKAHIDRIMKGIAEEGQLNDSGITYGDVILLAESFQRVLTGIFHHRIPYPGDRQAAPGAETQHPLAPDRTRQAPRATPLQAEPEQTEPAPSGPAQADGRSGTAQSEAAPAESAQTPGTQAGVPAPLPTSEDLEREVAGSERPLLLIGPQSEKGRRPRAEELSGVPDIEMPEPGEGNSAGSAGADAVTERSGAGASAEASPASGKPEASPQPAEAGAGEGKLSAETQAQIRSATDLSGLLPGEARPIRALERKRGFFSRLFKRS